MPTAPDSSKEKKAWQRAWAPRKKRKNGVATRLGKKGVATRLDAIHGLEFFSQTQTLSSCHYIIRSHIQGVGVFFSLPPSRLLDLAMFAPGTYGAPPLNVIDDETSSLDEDPVHEVSEMQPDSGIFETDAIQTVNPAPIDTHDCGVRRQKGVGGRIVQQPYLDRDDVGAYGIYVGNWSGRRRLQYVNNHIAADLIARNPAQVLLAQEVDRRFIDTLQDPRHSEEARSAPMAVEGQSSSAVAGEAQNFADREVNLHPWVVAVAPEDDGTNSASLIVAARSTRAEASTVVEVNRMFHREYKRRGRTHLTYSRMLVAQVEWKRPMHGQRAVQFLNVHFHHMAAKKDSATPLSNSPSLEGISLGAQRSPTMMGFSERTCHCSPRTLVQIFSGHGFCG